MRSSAVFLLVWPVVGVTGLFAAESLPFTQKVEVFRDKEGDIAVFTVRLEQPFLAEEFEKSNYLRLKSDDDRAYLIYPKETTFQQKHAEFYGRLRGKGKVKLQLSYEIVSENPDGSRRVQVRQGEIDVPIPAEPTGPREHLPGVGAPAEPVLCRPAAVLSRGELLPVLPAAIAGPLRREPAAVARPRRSTGPSWRPTSTRCSPARTAIQESLAARDAQSPASRSGDLNVHISTAQPARSCSRCPTRNCWRRSGPARRSSRRWRRSPRLVPEDQYLLQFNSMQSLGELLDLSQQWGGSLLRLFTVQAKDQQAGAEARGAALRAARTCSRGSSPTR